MGRRGGNGAGWVLGSTENRASSRTGAGLIPICIPSSKIVLDIYLNEHAKK